jgi:hypothetical protein
VGAGQAAGKNDIFDIFSVIDAPLTLILSPRFAGGEERKESSYRKYANAMASRCADGERAFR